jgi:hypothetical protein
MNGASIVVHQKKGNSGAGWMFLALLRPLNVKKQALRSEQCHMNGRGSKPAIPTGTGMSSGGEFNAQHTP